MADNESNLNDRQKLFSMLRHLIEVLDAIILEREVEIPEDLREPLERAWRDFHERHEARIFNALEVAPLTDADSRGTISLEAVGLTGPHLEVKSRGFWNASKRYFEHRVLKALLDFLRWADIWLESLKSVIPVSDILVELKKVIEEALGMSKEE
jgi:hypothetical protein